MLIVRCGTFNEFRFVLVDAMAAANFKNSTFRSVTSWLSYTVPYSAHVI